MGEDHGAPESGQFPKAWFRGCRAKERASKDFVTGQRKMRQKDVLEGLPQAQLHEEILILSIIKKLQF